jgi:hypothetical protein
MPANMNKGFNITKDGRLNLLTIISIAEGTLSYRINVS